MNKKLHENILKHNPDNEYLEYGFERFNWDPNICTLKLNIPDSYNFDPNEDSTYYHLTLYVFELFKENFQFSIFQKDKSHDDKNIFYLYEVHTTYSESTHPMLKFKDDDTKTERRFKEMLSDQHATYNLEIFGSIKDAVNYVVNKLKSNGYQYNYKQFDWKKINK